MREEFEEWLQREMPAGIVISDPLWWAPRILKAATALQAERVAALEAQRTAYLDGTCVCPHSTAGSAEHYPGCPQRQDARVRELEAALDDIWACANSGYSLDDLKSKIALSATAREVGE
jgi:hypothetical protein